MRPIFHIILLIICILIAGALLSYPLYKLLQIFGDVRFDKLITHTTNFCALFLVFLYLHLNNILNRNVAGFKKTRIAVHNEIVKGILAGIFFIGVLEALLLLLGIHYPEPELHLNIKFVLIILVKAVISGLAVGLLEETIYRGALLGGLQVKGGPVLAILLSSFIYSTAHFLDYSTLENMDEINWYTGLYILPDVFSQFTSLFIYDAFLVLFAFGLLLALVRMTTGNIFQCIGIHAGTVMSIKISNALTDYNFDTEYGLLVNKNNHQLGILAFIWLIILILFYYKKSFKKSASYS